MSRPVLVISDDALNRAILSGLPGVQARDVSSFEAVAEARRSVGASILVDFDAVPEPLALLGQLALVGTGTLVAIGAGLWPNAAAAAAALRAGADVCLAKPAGRAVLFAATAEGAEAIRAVLGAD
jgi:ActR/RegA family two-component response regulator